MKNLIHIVMAKGIQNQTETVKDPIMSESEYVIKSKIGI